jgi:hypothetical protein
MSDNRTEARPASQSRKNAGTQHLKIVPVRRFGPWVAGVLGIVLIVRVGRPVV